MSKFRKIFIFMFVFVFIAPNLSFQSYGSEIKDLSDVVEISDYCIYKGEYGLANNSNAVVLNGVYQNRPLRVRDRILISFKWHINDSDIVDAAAGSFFKFKILDPDYLKLDESSRSGDIVNPNNASLPLGTYYIDDDGIITMTLNQSAVSSGIHNGTFSYASNVVAENTSYDVLVDRSTTISIVLGPRLVSDNSGIWGTHRSSVKEILHKYGRKGNQGKLEWIIFANMDQFKELYSVDSITKRENVVIEDKLVKALDLDKSFFNVTSRIMIPYVDPDNNQLSDPAVHANVTIRTNTFGIGDMIMVEPNPGETYDEFKIRFKSLKNNKCTLGFYDNPDSEHSVAILFGWGDSPGALNPRNNQPYIFDDFYSHMTLSDKFEELYADGHLTDEQKDLLNEKFSTNGPSGGKVLGFSMHFKTTPDVSSVYHNEATMYWGESESITADTTRSYVISGATAELSPININVSKVWEDGKNDPVVVELYKNGVASGEKITLNSGNSFSGSFNNLYRFYNGSEIEYTVKEVDVPDGYLAKVSGDVDSGFVITNTNRHQISATKVWHDENGSPMDVDTEISVDILKNGVKTGDKLVLSKALGLSKTFEVMVEEKDSYSIEEISVEGYKTEISGDVDNGFIITNTKESSSQGGDINSSEESDEGQDTGDVDEETGSADEVAQTNDESGQDGELEEAQEEATSEVRNGNSQGGDIVPVTFDLNEVPDVNDEDVPEVIVIIGDDGTPLGKYTKKIVDGELAWIGEDGLPLGKIDVPQTGRDFKNVLLIIMSAYSLALLLLIRRTKVLNN